MTSPAKTYITAAEHFERARAFFHEMRDADAHMHITGGEDPLTPIKRHMMETAATVFLDFPEQVALFDISPDVARFINEEQYERIATSLEDKGTMVPIKFTGKGGAYELPYPVPDAARAPFKSMLVAGLIDNMPEKAALLITAPDESMKDLPWTVRPDAGTREVTTVFLLPLLTPEDSSRVDHAGTDLEEVSFFLSPRNGRRVQIYQTRMLGTFMAGAPGLISVVDDQGDLWSAPPDWAARSVDDLAQTELSPEQKEEFREIQFGASVALTAACALDVMNQPTIATTKPGATRQVRRALERSVGVPSERVRQVVWNLSREAVEAQNEASGRKGVALHVRRGHLRRAKQHYKGAFYDAQRGEWFQWIADMWVGHPAYGTIRRDRYVPLKNHKTKSRKETTQ